jgi:putative oxidoreductase
MNLFDPLARPWPARLLSLLRIVVALILLQHGVQKVFGYPHGAAPAPPWNPATLMGVAGVIETTGGILLLLGLFTRVVAFILSGEMAVAYFKAHAPRAFLPIVNHGELAAVLCFVFLYLTVAGGGAWSLDTVIRKRAGSRIA